ncbi:MAG: S-layer homology domain-containing protein [Clostridia bacterium]|nr:S-layer homology domain-containing protein [Clostridia bacterium]
MKRRILGIFVLITILLAGIPAGAEFIDVHGTKYEDAVRLLCDIEIMEGVSPDFFEPSEPVRRSDAARYIALLSGVQGTGGVEVFTDVPSSHPDFAAIGLVHQMGIVSGVGDGCFDPDGFVSAAQAAKMLVTLAGYQPHAEAEGGYPTGYLSLAHRLEILDGVSTDASFAKGDFARMLYNTLFVFPAEQASYGDTDGSYTENEKNILKQFLHISEVKGMVTANAATAVRGAVLRSGEVAVEGSVFYAPDALAQKIGRQVVVYYKENEFGEKEVISFRDAGNTTTLTLDAEDVLPATTVNSIVYQRSEDTRALTLAIASDAVVLYNGSACAPFTADDLRPLQGRVCITETRSGTASLIVVEEYKDMIVADVNKEESILYFKNALPGETELSYADTNVYTTVTDTKGNLADLGSCSKGTVLSVMESRDKSVRKIVVSTEKIGGIITEKTDDTVYIDGKSYAFSANFAETIPAIGDNVQLALNFVGEIVAVEANVSSRKYGYLMYATFEGKGLSRAPKVKILTSDDEIKVFEAAESVKINSVTVGKNELFNSEATLSDAANAEVSKIYNNNETVEQLIVYELNEKGEFSSITTAENRTEIFERDRSVFSLQYEADSGMFLAYGLRMFNSKLRIPTDTIVFSVGESYTGSNDDQYKVTAGSSLEHSGHYPGLKLYDLNEENEAAVMVTKLDLSDAASMYESNAVLVKSVSTVALEDGEICEAVRVVGAGGKEQLLYNPNEIQAVFSATAITNAEADATAVVGADGAKKLPANIAISQLEPGDVIKYAAVNDNLTNAMVCFRAGSPKELEMAFEGTTRKWPSATNDYYLGLWVYSKVIYAGENGFRFYATNHKDEQRERVHTYGSATVLIFDTVRQSIKVGSANSLSKDDMFFASRKNAAEHLIVIYR